MTGDHKEIKKPIDKEIFKKMLFCDEVFRFMSLEETLLFTGLDVDLNSFPKEADITETELLGITHSNLSKSFSCDQMPELKEKFEPPSDTKVQNLIDHTLASHEANTKIWQEIKKILLSKDSQT